MKKPKPLVDEPQAYRYAIWLLTRRPYSVGELQEKFRRRFLSPEIQEKVLTRLIQKKFVNDETFSEIYVNSKMNQGWGPHKIKLGLQKKKIARGLSEKAVGSAFPPEKINQSALEILGRQKQRFLRKKEKKKGQRLELACQFLVRKGYSFQVARLAVTRVFGYNSDLPHDD